MHGKHLLKALSGKYRYLVVAMGILLLAFTIGKLISHPTRTSRTENSPPLPTRIHHPAPFKPTAPVPKQILVKFKKGVDSSVINAQLIQYNAKIVKRIEGINTTVLEVPQGQEDIIVSKLKQTGIIEYAERSHYGTHHFTPNDTDASQQWHIQTIGLDKAWDVTQGKGIKVGVVDSGVMVDHPDLANKVVASTNALDNSTEIADTEDHGTDTVGMITANTNNGVGIAGTCPECEIVFAKDGGDAGMTDASVANGITWAVDQGAKVVNVSSGFDPGTYQTLQDAASYVWSKGAILVVSAGEDDTATVKELPCSYPNVVCVTASNQSDQVSSWAGKGDWIKLAAPGEAVYTTNNKGAYAAADGTSFASPLVAGVAALVWSTSYGTSNQAVVDRLCNTADKIAGTGTAMTCGRVNAFNAVQGATGTSPQPSGGGGVPSPVCLGSCPTSPSPSAPSTSTGPSGIVATQAPTTVQPSGGSINPSTAIPLPTIPTGQQPLPGGGGNGGGGLVGLLIIFLLFLLNGFLHLFG